MSCCQHHPMLALQDLSRTLEAAGGCELTFNAITALTAARMLNRIAEAEGVPLEASTAQAIAGASGGDLLNAIETLQLYSCGKQDPALLRRKKVGRGARPLSICKPSVQSDTFYISLLLQLSGGKS